MTAQTKRLNTVRSWPIPSIVFLALMAGPAAQAQSDTSSLPLGIVASGSSQLTIEPQSLRLKMRIQAQGKDAKSAIKSLTGHKDRVRKALIDMNANPDSIQFASTRLSTGNQGTAEQRQYMQMMRMVQRQAGGTGVDPGEMPTIYTATASIRVDWPLPTQDPDALALLPQGLIDQINQRDLAGNDNKPDLSEEELEKLESAQEAMEENYGYSMSSEESTEPTVLFIGRPTAEQRQQVLRQAFQRARESADLTAAALDTKIARLKTAWPYDGSDSEMMMAAWNRYGSGSQSDSDDGQEYDTVSAATADALNLKATVKVVYDFE